MEHLWTSKPYQETLSHPVAPLSLRKQSFNFICEQINVKAGILF